MRFILDWLKGKREKRNLFTTTSPHFSPISCYWLEWRGTVLYSPANLVYLFSADAGAFLVVLTMGSSFLKKAQKEGHCLLKKDAFHVLAMNLKSSDVLKRKRTKILTFWWLRKTRTSSFIFPFKEVLSSFLLSKLCCCLFLLTE